MKERPILFSSAMVRAILEGRKTVTRRLVTVPWSGSKRSLPYEPYWVDEDGELFVMDEGGAYEPAENAIGGRFGAEGDRLWVRETWHPCARMGLNAMVEYRAGELTLERRWDGQGDIDKHIALSKWIPSIFMRRWASRILLEVVSVRIERLHKITEEDAKREGVDPTNGHPIRGALIGNGPSHREGFAQIWEDINGKRASWASNPWVFRVEFRKVRQ